jgi:hypothetical protein
VTTAAAVIVGVTVTDIVRDIGRISSVSNWTVKYMTSEPEHTEGMVGRLEDCIITKGKFRVG